jgi:hypothetical protein
VAVPLGQSESDAELGEPEDGVGRDALGSNLAHDVVKRSVTRRPGLTPNDFLAKLSERSRSRPNHEYGPSSDYEIADEWSHAERRDETPGMQVRMERPIVLECSAGIVEGGHGATAEGGRLAGPGHSP